MKRLALAAAVMAAVGVGCSSSTSTKVPSATPTATAVVTATPTVTVYGTPYCVQVSLCGTVSYTPSTSCDHVLYRGLFGSNTYYPYTEACDASGPYYWTNLDGATHTGPFAVSYCVSFQVYTGAYWFAIDYAIGACGTGGIVQSGDPRTGVWVYVPNQPTYTVTGLNIQL